MSECLDASVVLATVLPDEPMRPRAIATLRRGITRGSLAAADILPQELTNALAKLVRRGRMDAVGAAEAQRTLLDLPWTWYPVAPHLEAVLRDAAAGHGHPYDLMQLHAAHAHGARLLTADRRFHAGLIRHPWRRRVSLLPGA